MTMHVRTPQGSEDSFASVKGCGTCGAASTIPGKWWCDKCNEGMSLKKDDNCPKCKSSLAYAPRTCESGIHAYIDGRVEPDAVDVEGNLTVTLRGRQLGYYPAGSWVSWRIA